MIGKSHLPPLRHEDGGGENTVPNSGCDVDRIVDDFNHGAPWPGFGLPNERAHFAPSMDVFDCEKAIEIDAELPGMTENDIDVSVVDNVLTVTGEKKEEAAKRGTDYYMVERAYGAFTRSLTLPYEVDASKVEARFDKGVLKITLPKPVAVRAKTKKIKVRPAV